VVVGECGEQCVGVVSQVEPVFLPPLHQFVHGGVKIMIDAMPRLGVDNYVPRNCLFHVRALQTLDVEEVVPHIEMGVNPHVGLAQSLGGRDVQDPHGGKIVQLQAIVLQQRTEELVRWHTESLLIKCQESHHVSVYRCGGRIPGS
jgi:hypothetical protein